MTGLEERDSNPEPSTPAWAWILLGWLLGRAWAAHAGAGVPYPLLRSGQPWVPRECTVEAEPLPSGIPAARDFRRVPGVGEARALALVDHLWRAGEGTDFGRRAVRWEEVQGIGPVTAGALRRAFPTGSGGGR